MSPLQREALLWIGGAVLIAAGVYLWLASTAPVDDLGGRYSVL